MKKPVITALIIALLLGFGLVVANSTSGDKAPSSSESASTSMDAPAKSDTDPKAVVDLTSQSEVTMDINDFAFSKPNIKIKVGTKVTWTNRDSAKHNVILDDTASGAPTPAEVKADVFAGPLLTKGESYSFTFNKVSTNNYHCSPHPYMKGVVTVVE